MSVSPLSVRARLLRRWKACVLVLAVAGLAFTFIQTDSGIIYNTIPSYRRLSLARDYFTGENVKTINGVQGGTVVPQTSCPLGKYRRTGNTSLRRVFGQREDGCVPCPRGSYGSTLGLTSSACSGLCPKGTYSNLAGLTSVAQCTPCPPDTYGASEGLSSKVCSNRCPMGTYNPKHGSTSLSECVKCPPGYRGWQCTWAIQPSDNIVKDTDHQHLEFFGLGKGFRDPYPLKRVRTRTPFDENT